MTKENAAQYLPLVKALADGKTIQFYNGCLGPWKDCNEISEKFPIERYRIKPEPMEIWVNVYPSGAKEIFDSNLSAGASLSSGGRRTVKFREVIE